MDILSKLLSGFILVVLVAIVFVAIMEHITPPGTFAHDGSGGEPCDKFFAVADYDAGTIDFYHGSYWNTINIRAFISGGGTVTKDK